MEWHGAEENRTERNVMEQRNRTEGNKLYATFIELIIKTITYHALTTLQTDDQAYLHFDQWTH